MEATCFWPLFNGSWTARSDKGNCQRQDVIITGMVLVSLTFVDVDENWWVRSVVGLVVERTERLNHDPSYIHERRVNVRR
jgi:hypothetical protein